MTTDSEYYLLLINEMSARIDILEEMLKANPDDKKILIALTSSLEEYKKLLEQYLTEK